ncbi:hypothetical protein FK85_25175 [Halorubrum saccharovorum]|uniref:Uncharacterized protein n=1 Tax=Halorubrum saccharovorum TaxID=2248 RepID=A0A0F8D6F4_9EURY|nr:hypothetical protein FK85_25175 [Halorubrum saccharovorum]
MDRDPRYLWRTSSTESALNRPRSAAISDFSASRYSRSVRSSRKSAVTTSTPRRSPASVRNEGSSPISPRQRRLRKKSHPSVSGSLAGTSIVVSNRSGSTAAPSGSSRNATAKT